MNIGLDFDGVIANSHPLKVIIAKKRFGVNILPEHFRRELVIERGLLTREQYRAVGVEAMDGSHLLPPVHESLMYLPVLLREKHSIRIITSRTEKMLDIAKNWLAEEKIILPIQGTGYGLSKITACKGLDLYVDDDLEKLLSLIDKVKHLLFFSWPWNAHEKEPKGIERVSSWWEIYNYIRYET